MEKVETILATMPPPVRVLEAGGGSETRIKIPGASYIVIDISPEQLERNTYAAEKLLGDLQTFDYGTNRFDVALFWDVLEHLRDPSTALINAAKAVSPGGLVLVKGPVLRSLKGLTTKVTPHWVHVAYYRIALKQKNAGKPGYAPFKTEHAGDADPDAMVRNLEALGLRREVYEFYITGQIALLKKNALPIYWIYRAVSMIVSGLTLGRYGGLESEFILLMRRPAT